LEARYLRVKNWADFQHYANRRPPWIKLYNDLMDDDDRFEALDELHQWQLVRIWLMASKSSRFTLDEAGKEVPVIADDERTIRRAIKTLKKVPLPMFVREGWLIPVAVDELLNEHRLASTDASALLAPALALSQEQESKRKRERPTRAVTPTRDAQPSEIARIIDLSLKEGAA